MQCHYPRLYCTPSALTSHSTVSYCCAACSQLLSLAMPRSCSARHLSGCSRNSLTAVLIAATMGSTAAGANVQPVPSPSPAGQQQHIWHGNTIRHTQSDSVHAAMQQTEPASGDNCSTGVLLRINSAFGWLTTTLLLCSAPCFCCSTSMQSCIIQAAAHPLRRGCSPGWYQSGHLWHVRLAPCRTAWHTFGSNHTAQTCSSSSSNRTQPVSTRRLCPSLSTASSANTTTTDNLLQGAHAQKQNLWCYPNVCSTI